MILRQKWRKNQLFSPFVIELLIIMFIVEFVKGALLITILPVYMKTGLGASAFIIGWTLAAQYIGDNVLRTPVGWIIDKLGYRTTMLTGVLLTFISVILMATTSQYIWMIVGCALLGFGTAPLWPCVITGTTEVAGEDGKATIMSVVYMAWLSGVGLGPVAINFFVGENHYSTAFRLLIACMTVVVLVALMLPRKSSTTDVGTEKVFTHAKIQKAPLAQRISIYLSEVKRSLSVSPLMFPAMFAQTFALGILTPILTLYAKEVLKLSSFAYSMFLIAGGAVTVICLVPMGKWVDRRGIRPFLIAGFTISAAALLLFTYAKSMTILYVLVALLGIGYAFIIPSWNALIASAIPPEKRGAVWGFFLTIEGLGMIVGPIVSGKLWDVYGYHAPFLMSGSVLVLLLVLQMFISIPKKGMVR
ncbi:MFS transporter [Paenibacillus sp. CGMCC 1.16610]|uniref:MFS transporter n=1 Tax=Paenibacillus anseongense TaxID=2682845 RepID=A0ABW9UCE4_9BACL|nr:MULTISPECIES: MFS transporter [Paenibacillus]MBA2937999.1 MFS transporter [Paenibacillus sp. CGMCC 1.16610]MVQ37057.1 MFS transporter [Paenibacillus anseongense]